jgi:hypothetical protein
VKRFHLFPQKGVDLSRWGLAHHAARPKKQDEQGDMWFNFHVISTFRNIFTILDDPELLMFLQTIAFFETGQ